MSTAYKVIGEEVLDHGCISKAITIITGLDETTEIKSETFNRQTRLDLAKLFHLEKLLFKIDTNSERKIQLIRGLIKECPNNGEYWVYHGIFQTDGEVKLRSFYRAIQLNPKVTVSLN